MRSKILLISGLLMFGPPALAQEQITINDIGKKLEGRALPEGCVFKTLAVTHTDSGTNELTMSVLRQANDSNPAADPVEFIFRDVKFDFEGEAYGPKFSSRTLEGNYSQVYEVVEGTTYDLNGDEALPSDGHQGPYLHRKTMRLVTDQTTGEVISLELTKEYRTLETWISRWETSGYIECQ